MQVQRRVPRGDPARGSKLVNFANLVKFKNPHKSLQNRELRQLGQLFFDVLVRVQRRVPRGDPARGSKLVNFANLVKFKNSHKSLQNTELRQLDQLFSMFSREFNDLFHAEIPREDRSWLTLPTLSNSKTRTKACKTGNSAN